MAYHSIPGSGFHYLNSPFGDTTFTKVFVGGLAWETQSETLRQHFEQYGEILEAVVITDKNTGRSKGYGFVSILLFVHLIHPFFFIISEVDLVLVTNNIFGAERLLDFNFCFGVIIIVTLLVIHKQRRPFHLFYLYIC